MVSLVLTVLLFTFLVACAPQSAIPTQGTVPAIVWQRSGGIAGICQYLMIGQDRSYELRDCIDDSLITEGTLSTDQWNQLSPVLERYGEIEYSLVPPEDTADMFTDEVSILGTGNDTPTQEEQVAISEQLAQLASELALPTE